MIKTSSFTWILKCIYSHTPLLICRLKHAKHEGEYILFADKQKKHNFYLWWQNQVILEILKQIKIGTSDGVGYIPYNMILCIFYFSPFFLALITLKGPFHLHLRCTLPNLHNDSFLCAHWITNPPTPEQANHAGGASSVCRGCCYAKESR